ncbi:MAG TPA: hypothetical protein VFZ18_14110 [Longimicrobiaceae bacterium]
MRERDREIDLRNDIADTGRMDARRIGERLLLLDELEDTLDQVRASGEPRDRIQALERRVSAERETIRALESRGELRFEEIARVMDDVDRRG